MSYVDGFIIPLKKTKRAEYLEMAQLGKQLWLEAGALDYHECIADDVKVGEVTSFPRSVKLEEDEVVVFSWIVYESREDRDRINAKVMADPRMKKFEKSMPFDGKRMIFGGFQTLLD